MPKEKHERGVLNTTIDKEILCEFRNYCKELGLPMNLLLESFMHQLVSNEFILKFGKNKNIKVDIED